MIEAVVFPLEGRRLGAAPSHLVYITAALSGREVRNPEREARRLRFNAALGVKSLADVELLIAWHAAMEGQTYGFLLTDYLDYKATQSAKTLGTSVTSQGRATVTTGAIWQMEKWYTVGSRIFKRKITRPKSPAAVYFDGVLKTATTHYTIDYTTGLLTVVSGSPIIVSWAGDFYVPVRFQDGELPLDLILYRPTSDTGIGEVPDVTLLEEVE